MARSRMDDGRFFSQRSAGSSTCPSASTTTSDMGHPPAGSGPVGGLPPALDARHRRYGVVAVVSNRPPGHAARRRLPSALTSEAPGGGRSVKSKAALLFESPGKYEVCDVDLDPPK